MDLQQNILMGLQIISQPVNLFYCFAGVLIGNLIGVLPGLGPAGAISILIPATLRSSPVSAIIILAGIYYGAQYGGSITSILMKIPGEASTIVTCLDGYEMAKKGRAGPALGISAFGSFIAGTIGILGLMFFAAPLAEMALSFGPPEYFALICVALATLTLLAQGSMYKGIMMALMGLLLGCVGLDLETSIPRFTFGLAQLMDGIGIIPLVMGLFGVSEILINMEKPKEKKLYDTSIKGILPTTQDWRDSRGAILRGSVIGFFLGVLPGGGAVLSSFTSYAIEKKISKHPEKFGTGIIQGVAAPESANNAASQAAFIPLFALGIPSNVIMALLFGGLLIHGVQPGPLMIKEHPDIFWGVVISMYVGNIMLLALNIPLIGIWIRLLKVPYHFLFPLILLFCILGVYSVNNSAIDIYIMVLFGFVGYFMQKYRFEAAPLVMAYILSPILERSFRQSLTMSGGSFAIFFSRPISLACMVLAIGILAIQVYSYFSNKEKQPSRHFQ